MFSYEFYKILHLAGIILVFTSVGGFLTLSSTQPKYNKLVSMLHGIGLLVMLVSGFGIIAKLQIGFPNWVLVKIVLWLVIASLLVVAKKRIFPPAGAVSMAILIGIIMALLGVAKPF
jgi:hypothetical protein